MHEMIATAVGKLAPHYAQSGDDSANRLLAKCPRPERVVEAHRALLSVVLPGKFDLAFKEEVTFEAYLGKCLEIGGALLLDEIARAIPYRWLGAAQHNEKVVKLPDCQEESVRVLEIFFSLLPDVRLAVVDDIQAAYNGDPAALSFAEVQLSYPGVLAIASHRLAHEMYKLDIPIIPRIMSEWTHSRTGVDIHPGAKIGKGFFIDHATGVVIGETTTIGSNVKLYQGVTLGAKSFPLDANGNPIKHIQRHPTVEDDVVIYANATILGGETVIGKGSVIGGNVFLTESVAAGSKVKA